MGTESAGAGSSWRTYQSVPETQRAYLGDRVSGRALSHTPEVKDRIIQSLILLACLLMFWTCGGSFLFAQTKPQPEKVSVSCIAVNRPMDVYNAQSKKYEEVDDWHVDCTIRRGDKLVYGPEPLALGYPASYAEAMQAIDEFRKKKAAEIVKSKEKGE